MKKIALYLIGLYTVASVFSCSSSKKETKDLLQPTKEVVKEVLVPCTILTDSLLPQEVNLKYDITPLSYQELRLLRSYVYATKGYWFIEGDINKFFTSKTDWYYPLCDSLAYKETLPKSVYDIVLTEEEQRFVDRIDKRLKAMDLDATITNKEGIRLYNPALCVNLFQLDNQEDKFFDMLSDHNFAIAKTNREQLFNIYEANDYQCMPSFITTDLYLQAFHMYFGYVLKSLEDQQFGPAMLRVITALHDESMKMAGETTREDVRNHAEYNATFFAIAGRLLADTTLAVPPTYQTDYQEEMNRIMAQQDEFSPYLDYTNVYFPYSLFKPRGHYTRKESSQKYFRAMMWLQTASFCREDSIARQRTILMGTALNRAPQTIREDCRNVNNTLTFLMGEPDNLSVIEIADKLKSMGITDMERALKESVQEDIGKWLEEAFKTRNRIAPKIQISCADKINFMPQRYEADNEILGEMTDVTPDSRRAFPKGLDVFAALGVENATTLLDSFYREADNWTDYTQTAGKMKEQFGNKKDWNRTMYDKWMETLLCLQQTNNYHPGFMKTSAWQRKSLNTALASWAELKHDAILYAEQPMAAECGGGGELPIPVVVGYVEPNMPFWQKMKELLTLNRKILTKAGMLTTDLNEKTDRLEEMVDFCINVVNKEMMNEKLTDEEYMTIQKMGSSMEWFTLSIIDPELYGLMWEDLKGPDRNIAIVADVYTRNVSGCTKNGILHEATGLANAIYVPVKIGRNIFITCGATFSYYEFVRPLGERLTDEEWQQMLRDGNAPDIPKWMQPLMLDKEPDVNEEIFYNTGC